MPKGKDPSKAEAKNETDVYKFVDWGPPPDRKRRELIFDSLSKIISNNPEKGQRGKLSDE